MLNRRELALAALALSGTTAIAQSFDQDPVPPDASRLSPGDFLWPKPPRSWIPYGPMGLAYAATPAGEQLLADEEIWTRQREQYLSSLTVSQLRQGTGLALRDMTYEQFAEEYFLAAPATMAPGASASAGGGGFYVGHVAIVDLDPEQGPMVIEATPPDVRRISYADWLDLHRDDLVFHGRMRDLPDGAGEAIAMRAQSQVRKPYDFMNFDLLNARGFYCSKLAWYAVKRATGLAIDGNSETSRLGWFSPKQMFYCETIEHLNSSGRRGLYAR